MLETARRGRHHAAGDDAGEFSRHVPARIGSGCLWREFGEHLVDDHAEGIDVCPVIHIGSCQETLRCDVIRRAVLDFSRGVGVLVTGEPEIHDFGLPVFSDEDVGGLDVAVDDVLVVRVLKRITKLCDETAGMGRCHLIAMNQTMQVQTVDVLHHEVKMAFRGLTKVVHGGDVCVCESGHGTRLDDEAAGVVLMERSGRGQQLDGHPAVQRHLSSEIDSPHSTDTQDVVKLVLRQ